MSQPTWKNELKKNIQGEVLLNYPLADLTTIRAGGSAECLVQPKDPSDLSPLYSIARQHTIPITILGKGSNTLVADNGIAGIVLRLVGPYFEEKKILDGHRVRSGAGVLKSELLQFSINNDLAGLEFSSGIPGDIGGALKMNAGTKYGAYADILREVDVFRPETLSVETISNASEQSRYRHQTYIRDGVVTRATFQLKPGDGQEVATEVARIIAERAEKQPLEWPNFGSTFKNPDHPVSAGRMIEQTGLKGLTVGGAQVSLKHANFILNINKATATDILYVICRVQLEVYKKFNVWLEPEVQLLGQHPFFPPEKPPQS